MTAVILAPFSLARRKGRENMALMSSSSGSQFRETTSSQSANLCLSNTKCVPERCLDTIIPYSSGEDAMLLMTVLPKRVSRSSRVLMPNMSRTAALMIFPPNRITKKACWIRDFFPLLGGV